MNLQDIRQFAQNRGLKPRKLSKTDLVRCIQLDEGNFDCFATAYDGICDQYGCLWRKDCFSASKKLQ